MATRCCMLYVYTYIPHAPDRSGSTVATSNCTPQSVSIYMSVARRNVSGLRPRRARIQIHQPTTARPTSPPLAPGVGRGSHGYRYSRSSGYTERNWTSAPRVSGLAVTTRNTRDMGLLQLPGMRHYRAGMHRQLPQSAGSSSAHIVQCKNCIDVNDRKVAISMYVL
jgi:hypothetical protein